MSKTLLASLQLELLGSDAAEAPKEFRIFKRGETDTEKGKYVFSALSARKVLDGAKRRGNDFPIDYNHSMHMPLALDPAQAGKAAGWFNIEVRADELWAVNVRWTKTAAAMLADREYRYFSPTFTYSKDAREVQELLSVALTNTPATNAMQPLMASQTAALPQEAKRMETLLAALGLASTATEAEAVVALNAKLGAVVELLSLTGKDSAEAMLGIIKGWKSGSEQVAALSTRVTELETAALNAERSQLIADAKKAGKVPPAQETFLASLSLEQLKAFLSVAVPVATVTSPAGQPTKAQQEVAALSADEQKIAALFGNSFESVAARRAAHGGQVPVGETKKDEASAK